MLNHAPAGSVRPTSARVVLACLLSSVAALAEQAEAAETNRTMVGVGAEFGYQSLLGSNGKAFGSAPMVRVMAEVHPADAYIVQLVYGFAGHGLKDPSALFVESPSTVDWTGSMELHTINVGFKGFADLGQSRLQWFRPYMSSSTGAIYAMSTVDSVAVPSLFDNEGSWQFDFDTALGVEINLKYFAVGVFGRGGVIPQVTKTIEGSRVELLWPLSFGIAGSLAI